MRLQSISVMAILYLCVGVAAFAIQDLIMKVASDDYPIHQALVIRALAALPIALIVGYMAGAFKAIKGSTRAMLPRSLLLVITNLSYYLALATLPLATVSALYLTAPLMITVLSVLLLQEKVNSAQWAAVIAGFVGMLFIVHPGYGEFEWAMTLPLLSALAYAGSVIFVRKMGGNDDSAVIAFQGTAWLSMAGVVLGLMLGFGEMEWEIQSHPSMDFLLRSWREPGLFDFLALLTSGVVGAAATLFLTKAYTSATASGLAPFEYTALIWSIVLGWLVWNHLPSGKEWVGIIILVAAGLASVYAADKGAEKAAETASQT